MNESLRLLNIHKLADKIGLGASTIHKMRADQKKTGEGDFPEPIHFGKAARWVEHEIDAWLLKTIQAKRLAEAMASQRKGAR